MTRAKFGLLLLLCGCSKSAEPTARSVAAEREAAAKALEAQGHTLKFTARGADNEALVAHFPATATEYEPCTEKAMHGLATMTLDPTLTRDTPATDLDSMFKVEITPEMKAQIEAMRKQIAHFRRVECDTKAGATVGVAVP